MTYQEAIEKLNDLKIFPSIEVTRGAAGDTVTGLQIQVSPLLAADRVAFLKKLLGAPDWNISYLPNHEYISITKKIK